MKFLIQQGVFDGDEQNLINILRNKKLYPIEHENTAFDPGYVDRWYDCGRKRPDTFCYGSLEWIQQIQKYNMPWLKTMCNLHNFDSRVYYHYYKKYNCLFNKDARFVTYDELEFLLNTNNLPSFVRPAVGYKPKGFSGQLLNGFDENLFDKNESYMLARQKSIHFEWRAVVANRKCITGCQYKTFCKETNRLGFDPSSDFPKRVEKFVNEIIDGVSWQPDPIYIMDVVENDYGLHIMELNALSTSGWYECDYEKIVDAILEYYNC